VGTALLIPGVVLLVRPSTAEKELEALRDRTDLVPTGREGAFGARYRIVSDAPATTMFDVVHLTF
jgi:hypothetical protein